MVAHLYEDRDGRTPAEQMALDEIILRTAMVPTLRVYRWPMAAISFGYAQRFSEVLAHFSEGPLVRRWTGGGIVEHGRDVTFSIFDPAGGYLSTMRPAESYEQIHRMVLRVLAPLVSGAKLVSAGEVKEGAACFQSPSRHDIKCGDVKLCGGAQRRSREGLLHQGSIQGLDLPDNMGNRLAAEIFPDAEDRMISPEVISSARLLALTRYSRSEWLEKR